MQFRVTLNIKPHVRSILQPGFITTLTLLFYICVCIITKYSFYSKSTRRKERRRRWERKHFIFIKIILHIVLLHSHEPSAFLRFFFFFCSDWSTIHSVPIICGNSLYLPFFFSLRFDFYYYTHRFFFWLVGCFRFTFWFHNARKCFFFLPPLRIANKILICF